MKRTAYIAGGLLGMLGVIMGAFGAHALESTLTANGYADTYETGARYHMYHAIFLVVLAVVGEFRQSRWWRLAVIFAIVGTVIFAGTLYLLAIMSWPWMGAITPLGGGLLILSWGALLVHVVTSDKKDK
ncbi:MAG: DUF423 domain-containing protein [Bacteroidota bacterium]